MASAVLSFVTYVGDGSKRDFTFDMPYLDRDHIRVFVNDAAEGAFSWVTPFTIRFSEAPELNAAVMIRRVTPKQPLTAIANGSSLRAEDLNRQMLQAMYVAQEASDIVVLVATGTLAAPDSDAGLVDLEFPSIPNRRDGVLGFDHDGQFRVLTSADMPKGETGDKGPVGDVGPEGPVGPTGPQGGQGPIGLPFQPNFQGLTAQRSTYDASVTGTSYLDYQAGILYWKLSNTSGNWSSGVSFGLGPVGPQGPLGPTGNTGPQGPAGPQGDSGLNWRGVWSSLTAYSVKDGVTYQGSSYRCIAANTGIDPVAGTSYWAPIAMKGDTGATGSTGAVGPTGPQGPGANVGDIVFRAKNDVPVGFVKANGAALSRTAYAALFSTIGTTFGAGDGSTTFNVPDLRGEFIRGWDDARGIDVGRAFGSWQADAYENHTHTATAAAGGAHNHTFSGTTSNGSTNHVHGGIPTSSDFGSSQTARQGGAPNGGSTMTGSSGSLHTHTYSGTTSTSVTHTHTVTVNASTTGSTETRPRNVALLALIRY